MVGANGMEAEGHSVGVFVGHSAAPHFTHSKPTCLDACHVWWPFTCKCKIPWWSSGGSGAKLLLSTIYSRSHFQSNCYPKPGVHPWESGCCTKTNEILLSSWWLVAISISRLSIELICGYRPSCDHRREPSFLQTKFTRMSRFRQWHELWFLFHSWSLVYPSHFLEKTEFIICLLSSLCASKNVNLVTEMLVLPWSYGRVLIFHCIVEIMSPMEVPKQWMRALRCSFGDVHWVEMEGFCR